MSARNKWIVLLIGAGFLALLYFTSAGQDRFTYQVCVSFHGRSHCATASAKTSEDAIRAAQEIDCTIIANGRDENMVCLATSPTSIELVSSK